MSRSPLKNRYDFVFLYDVKDGNPNGDPDQDNLPRSDPENQDGLITDVCIKRKVRNYVMLKKGKFNNENVFAAEPGYDIFIRQGNVLNTIIESVETGDKKTEATTKEEQITQRQKLLTQKYYDIRTFGAVLSTGDKPAGTIRGPVQFIFSRSVDKIFQAEHSITRCAVATEKEKKEQDKKGREYASTFGSKATVPYALYRMHGFVSVSDACKTGFCEEDLHLLWEALLNAFEHDRSAARGEMNPRKLIIFKHDEGHLGHARSGQLFDLVAIKKLVDLPRDWTHYEVSFDENLLPVKVTVDKEYSLI
jgi:CRISPR-associated protein Csd2